MFKAKEAPTKYAKSDSGSPKSNQRECPKFLLMKNKQPLKPEVQQNYNSNNNSLHPIHFSRLSLNPNRSQEQHVKKYLPLKLQSSVENEQVQKASLEPLKISQNSANDNEAFIIRINEVSKSQNEGKSETKVRQNLFYSDNMKSTGLHIFKDDQNSYSNSFNPSPVNRVKSQYSSPQSKPEQRRVRKYSGNVEVQKSKVNNFRLIRKLGKGAFAEVFLAQHKRLKMIFALKVIKKTTLKDEKIKELVFREMKIHLSLKHENIVNLYDVFSDESNIYLLEEYLHEGNLHQEWKSKIKFPEKKVAEIVYDICQGVRKLHACSIIHRDLKLENILRMGGISKIADLGCAVHCVNSMRISQIGSPNYLSPEQMQEKEYDNKVDIWSIGIITFELLFGYSPFEKQIKEIIFTHERQTLNEKVKLPSNIPITESAKKFIYSTLEINPNIRPNIDIIASHAFLEAVAAKRQQKKDIFCH